MTTKPGAHFSFQARRDVTDAERSANLAAVRLSGNNTLHLCPVCYDDSIEPTQGFAQFWCGRCLTCGADLWCYD